MKQPQMFNITPPSSEEKRNLFCQALEEKNSNRRPNTTAKKNISEQMFEIEEIK